MWIALYPPGAIKVAAFAGWPDNHSGTNSLGSIIEQPNQTV